MNTVYARHPEALAHGHQGGVMFSPPGHVTKEGFFGIDGLRIFMPPESFEMLVSELTTMRSRYAGRGPDGAALLLRRSVDGD